MRCVLQLRSPAWYDAIWASGARRWYRSHSADPLLAASWKNEWALPSPRTSANRGRQRLNQVSYYKSYYKSLIVTHQHALHSCHSWHTRKGSCKAQNLKISCFHIIILINPVQPGTSMWCALNMVKFLKVARPLKVLWVSHPHSPQHRETLISLISLTSLMFLLSSNIRNFL